MPNVNANLEAEQAVLGAILLDGTLLDECKLSSDHFYEARHQTIFKAFKKLQSENKAIDAVTLSKALGDALGQAGGTEYLFKLVNSVPTTSNFSFYENLVLEDYKIRKSINLTYKYATAASLDDLRKLVKDLEELESDNTEDEISDEDSLISIQDDLWTEKGEISGITSGLYELDRMTSGWQDGDLVIVAGRPSMGKTAFALTLGHGAADNDTVVDIFSLEMGKKQLQQRSLSSICNIDGMKWKNPNRYMTDDDKQKAIKGMGVYRQWNIYIHDEPAQTVSLIKSKIRQSFKKHPYDKHLVIIDYLQLIRADQKNDRKDLEIGEITASLKQVARKFNLPVILLSQLSRGVESRQDKRPMMSDLRESGAIEQDADIIAFLYRDDYYDRESEKQNIVEIILAKHRNGPVGTVEAAFIKEYQKFLNLDRKHEEVMV